MLKFIKPLTTEDLHQEAEYLIDGFLVKGMITMLMANGGSGKTWLAMGIAKYASEHNTKTDIGAMKVVYFDADNGLITLKERGIDRKLIEACPTLEYCHSSKFDVDPMQVLDELQKDAIGQSYKDTLIIFDSLRDFVDVDNDLASKRASEKLKSIRDAGATIIVLHHTTKNGSNYQGSNNLRNSIDNMFKVLPADAPEDMFHWLLEPMKERAAIQETAIGVDVEDLFLVELELEDVKLNDDEKEFIDKVKAALTERPNQNKTNLLKACGFKKDDVTARKRLEKFEGTHWKADKQKSSFIYSLI